MKSVKIFSLSCFLSILLFSFAIAVPGAPGVASKIQAAAAGVQVAGGKTVPRGPENHFAASPERSHNCDFAAVIANEGSLIAEILEGPGAFDDPEDFFYDFIIDHSATFLPDNDGYGVVYSRDGETFIPAGQKYYSPDPYDVTPGPLDDADAAVMDPANEAVMVMAHARNGNGGWAGGNHPFTVEWRGRTYAFMHNGSITGGVKYALWNELYNDTGSFPGQWFVEHPSNWVSPGDTHSCGAFIDSELLFHWIMKNVIAEEGAILPGMYAALTMEIPDGQGGMMDLYSEFHDDNDSNKINFVLSDCEALYVFRNTDPAWGDHLLSYEVHPEGFASVKTQDEAGRVQVGQYNLVYIPRNASPAAIDLFSDYGQCVYVDAANMAGPWDGSAQNPFRYIQDGIDNSANGNVLLVREGTYNENITFTRPDGSVAAVTVRSDRDGDPATYDIFPEGTYINGGNAGSVATFDGGEGRYSVLDGFGMTGGEADFGGGIYCGSRCSPTIRNNTIVGNTTTLGYKCGGGIYCHTNSSPLIENNTIMSNRADEKGGGICCWKDSRAVIRNNVIWWNEARYWGGGIYLHYCSPTIANNTFFENTADPGFGGGIRCWHSSPVITNTILWHDTGGEIAVSVGDPVVSYCDVEGGWAGTGNIDADPFLFDPLFGDFHLMQEPCQPGADSPCVNAGDPASPVIAGSTRTDGVRDQGVVDMGYHYPTEAAPPFSLAVNPEPLFGGRQAVFAVSGGDPLTTTFLTFSLIGPGSTFIAPLDVTLDLAGPRLAGRPATTDNQGAVLWTLSIPAAAAGLDVWFQALQYGKVTNVAVTWIR